ncbi:MAG: hypothetical protein IPI49_20840 [Myxococcales bacterium]|nr:hypothetical protein [Myxococcales bacterium]
MVTLVLAGTTTAAFSVPPAHAQGATPPPEPAQEKRSQAAVVAPDPKPQEQEKKRDAADALAATSTVPQFAARRGGTLGIPAASARDGLQAAIDILNNENSAKAFVKLEGLSITPTFQISVVAETFEESLPRVTVGMVPATTELFVAKLPSIGVRATWTTKKLFYVSAFQSEACVNELSKLTADQYAVALGQVVLGQKEADDSKSWSKGVRNECHLEQLGSRRQYAFSAGLRALRRTAAKGEGDLADGLAAEGSAQGDWSSGSKLLSLYASASMLWLLEGGDTIAGSTIEYPEVIEGRASAGLEIRGTKIGDANFAPRAGLYGTAAWNWWKNKYNFGTVERSIRGAQFEGGIYFSVRAPGSGVHGLVSLSVLKPFGNDEKPQILVGFSQSTSSNGTAPLSAASGAK